MGRPARQPAAAALRPRKAPAQARSAVTVEAILEATLQVLQQTGFHQLTTTRVAERAGVSVGTLYQYYPNKRALLAAVLQAHLGEVVEAVEAACRAHEGATLRAMVVALTDAFVEAKTRRVEVSLALYAPAGEAQGQELVRLMMMRAHAAVSRMLGSASDARLADTALPAFFLLTGAVGAVQGVLEAGAAPPLVQALRLHLAEMGCGYLERLAGPR
ncbi:MAG: TetR/AcrR family transcriptional regulator [Aquabacterium sp.]|nr:MAG: TetR/AcrR family transcriptional regulator [Aquabacterium sp.]